jgi:hypothetical protein
MVSILMGPVTVLGPENHHSPGALFPVVNLPASQFKNNLLQLTCKESAKLTEQGNLPKGSTISRISIISPTNLFRLLKALKVH